MGVLMADSCLADTAVLLTSLVLLAYYWSVCTFGYWRDRGVKTVAKATPLLGSVGDAMFLKRQFGLLYEDMYHELEGERFGGYYKMRQPAILLRDPELIKHVILRDFSSFTDNDVHVSEKSDPMFANNLFTMKGGKWRLARSKFSPIFSTGKIRNMFPLMLDVCNDLKDFLQRKIDSGSPEFNAKTTAANYTNDVVASCAFALKCNSFQDENNKFRSMGLEMMTPGPVRGFVIMMVMLCPPMGDFLAKFGLKFVPNHILNFFRGLVREAMEFREKNDVRRNDLIQLLMQLKKVGRVEEDKEDVKNGEVVEEDKSAKLEYTHDVLTAQAFGFFADGFETSSIALSFALHELAVNPEIQTRLRAELRKYVDKSDGKLTYDTLRECAYLDCVFHETLRKYPAVGVLTKTCTQRYQIPGTSVKIEVGTPVALPVQALHYDPRYFPDPDRFDPDRFNDVNKKKLTPCTYLSFGEGPRQCIGQRFALAQVNSALATIILNFEVTRSDKTQHPVVLDPNFFMASAVGGLHLNVKKLEA